MKELKIAKGNHFISSKTLEYKGYTGTVDYSIDDHLFYGRILGIEAAILYEGISLADVLADFQDAVDEYIQLSQAISKTSQAERKTTCSIHVEPDIWNLETIPTL